jgi:anti-anti-sigma factor
MFTSHLTHWVFHPAEDAARGVRQQVVAPALPASRVSRPSAAVSAVEVAVCETSDGLVIRVKGEARPDNVGMLLSGLLGPTARRPALVMLDLSELRSLSCLAMGVLVAYRRGVVRAGGRVCLADELQPPVREALARAELLDLFETTAGARTAPSY